MLRQSVERLRPAALAINAYADPAQEPTPVARIPDPQGPGCDAYKTALPNWRASPPAGRENGSPAIAANPDLSDFNARSPASGTRR